MFILALTSAAAVASSHDVNSITAHASSWQASDKRTLTTVTGSSTQTCGEVHTFDHYEITDAERVKSKSDYGDIEAISRALTRALEHLHKRIAEIEARYAVFNAPITNDVCEQIASLKTQLQSLQYNVYMDNLKNTSLVEQVNALQITADNTESKFSSHDGASIESRVGTLETVQTGLTTGVTSLNTDTAKIEVDLDVETIKELDMENRVTVIETTVTDLKSTFGDHKDVANKLAEDLDSLETRQTIIATSITTQTNNYDTIVTKTTNLSDEVSVLTGAYNTDEANHDALEAQMDAFTKRQNTLKTDMTDNQKDTKSLKILVSNLETRQKKDRIRIDAIYDITQNQEKISQDKHDQTDAQIEQFDTHKSGLTINERIDLINIKNVEIDIEITKIEDKQDANGAITGGLTDQTSKSSQHSSNELVLDQAAESLEMCGGGCVDCQKTLSKCTDCRKGYYSFFPDFAVYQCVDENFYVYGDKCDKTDPKVDTSKCSTNDDTMCHESHLWNDQDAFASQSTACRTIPEYNLQAEYEYGYQCQAYLGTCNSSCATPSFCAMTWPVGDPSGDKSQFKMCRCTPADYAANPSYYGR